ncbi:hypothetical protein J6590_001593 [Homalodisca vitripennis]|nr:hypothetical protein J6590_001593 [Homalodisca vitripennis]
MPRHCSERRDWTASESHWSKAFTPPSVTYKSSYADQNIKATIYNDYTKHVRDLLLHQTEKIQQRRKKELKDSRKAYDFPIDDAYLQKYPEEDFTKTDKDAAKGPQDI